MPPFPAPRDRDGFHVALICALQLEADCVHAVFDKFWEDDGKQYGKTPGDPNAYTPGVIGQHNVVLAYLPGMGTVNAAVVAGSMLISYPNIKLALVVGICGGMPYGPNEEEIVLGDVVISQAIVQYDFGRQYPNGFKKKSGILDTLGRPNREIRTIQAKLETNQYKTKMQEQIAVLLPRIHLEMPKTQYPGVENDILYHSSYVHQHNSSAACNVCELGDQMCQEAIQMKCEDLGCETVMQVARKRLANSPKTQPMVHFGIVGSGNAVMKSGQHRDQLARADEIVALEMEGAGVWDSFNSIVIKGVCDYADSHTRKGWQQYAAATAAACMKAFLMEWTSEHPLDNDGHMDTVEHMDNQTRIEILRWLCNVPYKKHHANMVKDLLAGSGKWLEQHDFFKDWRNASTSSVLWLHGIPGAGKSKLVSRVISLLQNASASSSSDEPIAYFYCTRNTAETERADPTTILRAVLKQVAYSAPDGSLSRLIVDAFRDKKRDADEDGIDPEPLSSEECVQLIIHIAKRTSMTIVIDALDECDPGKRHILLEGLETILKNSKNVVKLFVSSRDDADIKMRLTASPNIYISATDNASDVERYAHTEIDNAILRKRILNGNVPSYLQEDIISRLTARAQGMFLSVALQIQALCDHQRINLEEDVLEELSSLPKSLAELWADAMARISRKNSAANIVAIQSLCWILCAREALQAEEFVTAICHAARVDLTKHEIITVCENLVVLDDETNVFRYAHLSVREFMETADEFDIGTVESSLALQCLTFCVDGITQGDSDGEDAAEDSFLLYATLYWPFHSRAAWHEKTSELTLLLERLLSQPCTSMSFMQHWVSYVEQLSTVNVEDKGSMRLQLSLSRMRHPIFLVVAFAFNEFYNDNWTADLNDMHLVNEYGLTPLAVACNIENFAMARILVMKGAAVDIMDNDRGSIVRGRVSIFQNPLCAAPYHGWRELVEFLLEAGAQPYLPYNSGNLLALSAAAMLDDMEITKRRLAARAHAHMHELYSGKPPLLYAAQEGHTEVCRVLLEAGASPNMKSGSAGPENLPLEQACKRGDLSLIQLLLEYGADMEAPTAWRGTPLASAAWESRLQVVEYLLSKGADPRLHSGPFGTAFLSAVAVGSPEIVLLMLRKDLDVSYVGPRGTALGLAIGYRCPEALRLLLHSGADVHTDCNWNGVVHNAFTFAAVEGNQAIMIELLDFSSNQGIRPPLDLMLVHALDSAYSEMRSENIHLLLERGADVNVKAEFGKTTLHYAVQAGRLEDIRHILSLPVDLDAVDQYVGSILQALCHRNPDHYSASRNETEDNIIFRLLLEKGATFDTGGGPHDSFLQTAAYENRPAFIAQAIEQGAVFRNDAGSCCGACHAAAARAHHEALEALLQSRPNIDASCEPYGSILTAAACHGRQPASQRLERWRTFAERDADDEAMAFEGSIWRVRPESYDQIAARLLDAGARVDIPGGYFGCALQAAAYVGNATLVQKLIAAGAEVCSSGGFYGSCLQAAAAGDETPVVDPYENTIDILLAAGADVNARGGFFNSCLQAAVHSDNVAIVCKLLSAGAEVSEDGQGFYGGCISAALSFGKQILMSDWNRPKADAEDINAEKILGLLLRNVPAALLDESCFGAYLRSRDKQNTRGLTILQRTAPFISLALRGRTLEQFNGCFSLLLFYI
ncbi:hypothetical protein LTR84_003477 [Exophiala bonariae]|uniref:Nucleoside phosphorylase domain-containing protein n=1 Tax=Exophiala bonariae TaxID=1690606 RepID=A0AAV9N767_9EURO|nr:hypothetical protein LTR84_003477 [Exophiala bonariae]